MDQRFQLRGEQKISEEIVIITIHPYELVPFMDERTHSAFVQDDTFDITDNFYWNKKALQLLLSKILKDSPRAVAMNFQFHEELLSNKMTPEELNNFTDSRVIWGFSSPKLNNNLLQKTFLADLPKNVAALDFIKDEDGILRRIHLSNSSSSTIIESLLNRKYPFSGSSQLLNFRGGNGLYHQYSFSEVVTDSIKAEQLKGKIVIIGPETNSTTLTMTPVGWLHRNDLLAQSIDSTLNNLWLKKFNPLLYAIFMGIFTILSVFILTKYPQEISLYIFIWLGTLNAALSAWIFDTFYFWIPVFSPLVVLISVWVIFIGYQAQKIEKAHYLLKQEQTSLKEIEQLKNNFVSLISHDLKTPIAKIQGILDRLDLQSLPPGINQDLNQLRICNEELHRYIHSILSVLRVESRELKINLQVEDINEIVDAAIQQLLPLALEKNILLTKNLEPLFSLEFDPQLMKEVIINLIDNAIKFTPKNGTIEVSTEEVQDHVIVRIKDSGEGISPEDLKIIWDKFSRGAEQDLKTKGTGLGLYLVKYFVELHGGTIDLQSQKNRGTTVSFTLPINDASNSTLSNEVYS